MCSLFSVTLQLQRERDRGDRKGNDDGNQPLTQWEVPVEGLGRTWRMLARVLLSSHGGYGPTQRFGTVSRVKRCGDATAEDG